MKITAALVGLGLIGVAVGPALAQTGTTVIVPAPTPAPPSASPSTTVTPGPAGTTTIVVPHGSSVTVTPPAAQTRPAAVAVTPWCAGAYAVPGGTNFGGCPGYLATR
jgi:hypothetical protein